METVVLGKSGLAVTNPAMGCLPLQRCDMDYAVKLLQKAYESGITFFDTANAYSDSEKKLGMALSDVRKDIIIATKSMARDKETVLKHIENSLKILKTDYIDLFQLHKLEEVPDFDDPNGIYSAAVEAKERGWVRHIGFTSHKIGIAEECVDSGMFETCMFPFSYISAERDIALAERCRERNVGFIAMKGLAGGLLTNVKACQAFMNQYDNVVPVWGIQKLEELEQWLRISEEAPEMDAEIEKFIAQERKDLAGSFCRGCGYCKPCAVGIDISECGRMNMLIRRSPWRPYMSDEWYNKMQKINDCIECYSCVSKCPYGNDIPNMLKFMLKDYNEFYEAHKDQL